MKTSLTIAIFLNLSGIAPALRDKFDIRQFHEVVLSNCSVPLNVPEELVDRWIKSKQAG
jgi:uncharacterized protein (DUF885 family)